MNIQLSDHFTYSRLLRFTVPSIVMMIFTSIYGVVDGYFVSNYVGETPFAAVNLIMPFLMVFSAVGFMVGAGGSALVSATMGAGDKQRVKEIFSLLIYLLIGVGALFSVAGFLLARPVAKLLGASDAMLPYCVIYARINTVGFIPFMLQFVFQSFLVTAERPKLGLVVTVAAGVTNMVLDALFMGVFHWGVVGAACATVLGQCVGGLIPLFYFILPNSSPLRLGKTHFDGRAVLKTCANGSAEFMTNISTSIVNIFYNIQLMRLAGEAGVAAYGVIMYVNLIFFGVFLGYSIGAAPVVGYHYGAQNSSELQNLLRTSLVLISSAAVLLTALAELLSPVLSRFFVGYDPALYAMTNRGFRLYSLCFLISGYTIFGGAFFTALNNGLVAAIISFSRTLIFQTLCVFLLPLLLGLDGVWLAEVLADVLALAVAVFFLFRYRKTYHYL